MKLNAMEISILKLLLETDDYLSSYEIADQVNISRRSVREYMNALRIILKDMGFDLISSKAKGYMIEMSVLKNRQKLKRLIEMEEFHWTPAIPDNSADRANYIELRLLRSNNFIRIDDISYDLSTSRATISNDIRRIKEDLKIKGIEIHHKPNYGMYVKGLEINIRKVLCDLIFAQLSASNLTSIFLDTLADQEGTIEYEIKNILDAYGIILSDISFVDFVVYLTVAIERIQEGKLLKKMKRDPRLVDFKKEERVVEMICTRIEDYIEISFSIFEKNEILAQLISKQGMRKHTRDFNDENYQLVQHAFASINQETQIDFTNDTKLEDALTSFLASVLFRLRNNNKLRTPLYLILEYKFPLEYNLAQIFAETLHIHLGLILPSSELAHISLYFRDAVLRYNWRKKRCIVINGLGKASIRLSKTFFDKYLSNEIEVVDFLQYYNLDKADYTNIDLVISLIPVQKEFCVPYINISNTLDEIDIKEIKNFIDFTFNLPSIEFCFTPMFFFSNVNLKNKDSLLTFFIDNLVSQYNIQEKTLRQTEVHDDKRKTVFEFKNGITLVNFNFHIATCSISSIIKTINSICWNKQESNIFIFTSYKKLDRLMFNRILITLSTIENNKEITRQLHSTNSYSYFISTLKNCDIT